MRFTSSLLLAVLLSTPALARPPDDIAAQRRAVDQLSRHTHARSASREISRMRTWIDEASTLWRRGDRAGLERTLVRLGAQAELVRAQLLVAATRASLSRTEEDLANVKHQVEAERRRLDALRGDGGE